MWKHPVDGEIYLESQEVAVLAEVSMACVWKWATGGVLPSYRRGGMSRKYFFRQADVEAFLEMKRVPLETRKPVRLTKRQAALASRMAAREVEAWAAQRG